MKNYRVKPGSRIHLSEWHPDDKGDLKGGKEESEAEIAKLREKLEPLQELLYAEHKHKFLIVLQAMDTGGKDGTIRHVFEGVNPQGVQVASFKAPSPEELDHDFLWRIHRRAPGKGQMVIFNRSHYEDVLIVRVHHLVEPDVWRRRYGEINAFEQMLANEGTTILKFFLHIGEEEQKKRLRDRLDNPSKYWKFNPDDLVERALWPKYMEAYEDAISETSTECAPWYIVPANHNWYRNLIISNAIVQALQGLEMSYPSLPPGVSKSTIQ